MIRRTTSLVIFVVLSALALACGNDDDADESVDAQALLTRASEALGGVSSFHFALTHENNGSTPIVLSLALTEANGDVQMPDKLQGSLKAKAGPLNVDMKIVAIGTDLWATDPFSSSWQKLGGSFRLNQIFDPSKGIREIVRTAKDPAVSGQETLDGAATYRVTVKVGGEALRTLLPVAQAGREVPVTLWIGKDDGLIRRIRLEGPLNGSEPTNIARRLDLSAYNQPVQIVPPTS